MILKEITEAFLECHVITKKKTDIKKIRKTTPNKDRNIKHE